MAWKTLATITLLLGSTACAGGGRGPGEPEAEGGGSEDGANPDGPPVPDDELGTPSTAVRRLSRREVDRIIEDVFGLPDIGTTYLPLDVLAPFDTDAESKLPSAVFVDGHEALADHVAAQISDDDDVLVPLAGCSETTTACLQQLVERLGRRLWRRPLEADEVEALTSSAAALAEETGSFRVGARVAIQGLLLSPEFIYVTQIGTEHSAGYRTLSPYELGTRLSLLILGTTPDDALLERLDTEALSDDDLVEIAEMLLDQRAEQAANQMVDFHTMWLGVGAPRVPAELIDDASKETEALLRQVLVEHREPWSQLFLYPRTYVTAELAELAELPTPASGEGWVDYPSGEQSGVLSHMSWLSQSALSLDETSPTKRGVRVVEDLLCRSVPPPPPNVDIDNVEIPETGCLSDFYASHAEPGTGCYSCHTAFDPVGRGLERWDAYGRYRETEPGRPECAIDGSGELDRVGEFSGPRALAELMVESGELTSCLTRRLVQFDTGRPVGPGDRDALERIEESFIDSDEDFRALILAYVTDPVFRHRTDIEACQ